MITIDPEKIPELPRPAMARPIMNAMELGAAPQRADPTSKKLTAAKNTHLGE